ncbi:MAG: TRAP transporter TatT component family protein [Bacteroidetes bacterium]|nr:TRAP transporter TatT component family protein [Bacteroidota bacterium]
MRHILLCVSLFLFSGCIQGIAVSTVGGIVDDGFTAITEESDLDFAEKALPGNIKLLEVMLKSDPDNVRMLVLTSQGYSSYALAYLEDSLQDRARDFYARGRDYGLRVLRQDNDLAKALDGTVDDLKAVLERKGKDLVPGAFWTAFGWGSFIQLSLDNPDAIGDLPRAEALMEFVVRHDSAYYYGGAHVFLGTLYGSRPKILGGNIDLARKHFESALRINGGKFLMTYVYQAKSVAVQTLDEELFDTCLRKVQETSLDILPEFRLANAIAKHKAQLLLSRRADLF